ncbi:MAG: hypothetical protein ABI210_14555 [Abditibacteriaceae bacterium]
MTQQNLLDEFSSLPIDAQRQVKDFVLFLRQKYQTETPIRSNDTEIRDDKFIGMWSDREDLADSTEWVRSLREKEWSR